MRVVEAETAASHINTSYLAITAELAQLKYGHRARLGALQATQILECESQNRLDEPFELVHKPFYTTTLWFSNSRSLMFTFSIHTGI